VIADDYQVRQWRRHYRSWPGKIEILKV